MKKIFLILTALFMSAMMWAETATFDGNVIKSKNVVTTKGESVSLTAEDVTCTVTRNSINQPGFYTSGGLIRYYSSDVMTLSVPEGNVITEIAFNMNSGAVGEAAPEGLSGDDKTWTGSAQSVSFTGAATVKINSIVVTYSAGTPVERTLQSIYIDGTATKLEYIEGESFDPAGLKVMGKYDKGDDTEITGGIEWTIVPGTLAKGTTSVTVTATAGGKTSEPKTIAVTVKEFVKTYANTYTSDVEYTIDSKVVWNGVEYDALKMAKNTPATITVPANTKNLHIHAAAWNKEGAEWTISGLANDVKITTIADAGVSGSSTTYTLQNNPETKDYFVISTNNSEAKEITITLPKDKRGVIFGVNAELQEGVVAAPTFTPTESEFDGSVEVTLSAEEGADIYYTLDGTTPTNASTLYTASFKLTATTTVKAIAIKSGKSSEVAEKTYTLLPVYTLAEIAAITPTGQKAVLVLDNEEIVELYTGQSGDVSGVYFQATDKKIELYNQGYAFPKTWVVGGKVSGRVMGEWVDFNGTWELKIATEEIEKLTYKAPPYVDETGITVNGRKYGFPIRMVKDQVIYR